MASSLPTSPRFRLNYRQQLAQSGLRHNPPPDLPSWLRLSEIPRFDFSPVSDQPRTTLRLDSRQLPKLHSAQEQMIREATRFNVAVCGRQMGKTTLGIERVARGAADGMPCGWFAPTYKYLEQVWRALRDLLEPVATSKSEQQHRIDVVGGGSVECWSLDDPDAARGRKYARIVVDEAALVRNLEQVWQASLRATLSVLEGDAWFLSTPKGLDYFHSLYLHGQDPLERDWVSWQMPSSASPYISPEEIEAARRSLPARVFAQEYLAQFLSLLGAGVFRGVEAVTRLEPTPPEPGHSYVIGVDWSAGGEDYTVFSVLDASLGEQVAIDRFSTPDFDLATERLYGWADLYRPQAIVAEQNSIGMPLVQRLQRGWMMATGRARPALPVQAFTTTNATKAAAVQSLSLAIENGEVTLLDDAIQTGELLAYEAERLPSGMIRYAAPEGGHDDTVTALMLAWQGASREHTPSRSHYAFSRP